MSKLITLAFVFVVAAWIAALGADCTTETNEKPDDILEYMYYEKSTNKNEDWFNNVRDVLLGLNIPKDEEITKEVLVKAFAEDPNKEATINWYVRTTLMNLQEHEYCSEELANAFLAIFQQEELKRFRTFFEGYWKETIERCEKQSAERITKDLKGGFGYQMLDKFFKTALKIKEPVSDEDYYSILRDTNWEKIHANLFRTVGMVYKNDPNRLSILDLGLPWFQQLAKKYRFVGPEKKIEKFVTEKCYLVFHPLHREFAIINLAQRFEIAKGTEMADNGIKFNIINEVNRLCLAWLNGKGMWKNDDMEKIIKDIGQP